MIGECEKGRSGGKNKHLINEMWGELYFPLDEWMNALFHSCS